MQYGFIEDTGVSIASFDGKAAVKHMELSFKKEIDKMIKMAEAFEVKDEATMNQAIEMINQSKKYVKRVDKERLRIKDPYTKFGKELDGISNRIKDPLKEIPRILELKVKPIALAIRDAKEKERKQAEALRRKTEAANAKRIKQVPVPPPAPAKADGGTFKTVEGSAKLNTVIRWTVKSFAKVPDEYKVTTIDERKLDAAIQSGAKVPGVYSYEDIELKTRASKF
jgi:hypothetical protein